MVKGTEQQKASPAKPGTAKVATKSPATTAGTRSKGSAAAGSGRPHHSKGSPAPSGREADGGKPVDQSPTPARRAMDGPELAEPTEAEIESQIKQLLEKDHDQGPSAELTLDLIIRSHVSDDPELSAARRAASEVFAQQLTHIRLDRQRLGCLSGEVLRQLAAASHLYLQHNRLVSTAAVATLPGLRFLALGHNRIEKVEGLSQLTQLIFLDLSYNRITKLDERALPTSLHFIKVEGNPCATGHANRYCLRRALKARCPQLCHMDRDLDEHGEEISDGDDDDDVDEENDDGEQMAGIGGAAPDNGRNAPLGFKTRGDDLENSSGNVSDGGGGGGLLDGVLDMLEDLERRAYQGATARSEVLLRCSVNRSLDLRASMQLRASVGSAGGGGSGGPLPGTTSGSRPGTSSGLGPAGTTPRPRSSGTGVALVGAAATAAAASSPACGAAAAATPARRSSAADGATAASLTSPACSLSPGAAAAAAAAGSARLSLSSSGAGGGGGSRPSSAGSGAAAAAAAGRLGQAPLTLPSKAQTSGGGVAALERQVEDDLGMLQARLQTLLEPASSSTLTQDAAIFDARQLIQSQMDRMRGQATERIAAQRDADAAVADAIRRLRTSSTLTALREQINLGPSRVAAARTAAAVAAARRAGPAAPSLPEAAAATATRASIGDDSGGERSEPVRPWSSSGSSSIGAGGSGGVPLQLSLGSGPGQTLPHNVLRESLLRLESMLSGSGRPVSSGGGLGRPGSAGAATAGPLAACAAAPPPPVVGKASASGASGGGTSKQDTAAEAKKAVALAAPAASAPRPASGSVAAGTKGTGSGSGTAAMRSRPGSGGAAAGSSRPGSASGRPAGAVVAAAKAAAGGAGKGAVAAAEVEAERLAGDDAGTEGLYSDDDEPKAAEAKVPDFGFMFKTALPPNPFGPAGKR